MSETNVEETRTIEEHSLWKQVADAASDLMYLVDVHGKFLEANSSLCRLHRKPRSAVIGTRITDHLQPDDIGVTERTLREIASRRLPERSTRTYQFSGQEPRTFEFIETPLLRAGEVWAIAGIGREITQEVLLEHKLWDTQEQRQSSVEFALRTSLGLVKGYVSALGQNDTMPEHHRARYLQVLQEEMEHLDKMIEDILDIRRYEQAELDFRSEIVNLRDCIDLVVRQFAPEAERRDIQLCVELSDHLTPYYGPREALLRVLINLVQNAIHHTLHSGTVWISVHDHEGYFELQVKDNGVGIPEEELPYIFDKYYRGTGNTSTPGAGVGLGLAIVRTLVDAIGGKIFVKSQIGAGSVFRVVIPRRSLGKQELEDELESPGAGVTPVRLAEGGK